VPAGQLSGWHGFQQRIGVAQGALATQAPGEALRGVLGAVLGAVPWQNPACCRQFDSGSRVSAQFLGFKAGLHPMAGYRLSAQN
jgi:hypothetical protein